MNIFSVRSSFRLLILQTKAITILKTKQTTLFYKIQERGVPVSTFSNALVLDHVNVVEQSVTLSMTTVGILLCSIFIAILLKSKKSPFNFLMTVVTTFDLIEMTAWSILFVNHIVTYYSNTQRIYCGSKTDAWISLIFYQTAYHVHNINICLTSIINTKTQLL